MTFHHHHHNPHHERTAMHHHAQRQGLGRRVASAVAVFACLLVNPAPATAGEYPQHFCRSGGGNAQVNAWYGVGNSHPGTSCNGGLAYPHNGVYYNTPALPTNGYGGLHADAPPGARYRSLTLNLNVPWQSANRRTYVNANSAYAFSWWNSWGGTSSYNPEHNFFTLQLGDSPYFEIGQACHGAGSAGCQSGDFYFTGAEARLHDVTAPAVQPVLASPLFNASRTYYGGDVEGVVDITDSGHGPASAVVRVDDVTLAETYEDWKGSCNYRLANPCSSRLGWSRTLNTKSFADGVHTVRFVADDGVGQGAFAERTVIFDNTPPTVEAVAPFNGQTHTGDDASFEVSAGDATSGVARIQAAIDGAPWKTVVPGEHGTVSVTGEGVHTVAVRALDRAGNMSGEQVNTFTIQAPPSDQRIETEDGQPLPGAPGPGDVVRCNVGGPWSDGTRFTFRWLRDGQPIDGAAGQTYRLTGQDAARSIVCEITAHNGVGEAVVVTDPVQTGTESCFGMKGPKDPCGDFDNDGEPNQTDPDDDGDGVLDGEDPDPFNPNVPGDPDDGAGGSGVAVVGGVPVRTAETVVPALGPPNNGVNASNRAQITVSGTRRRKVAFGRRIATVAHLRDENGRPITGAQVTVLERMNVPGATWVPARAPLVSDSRGRLRWVIPAKFSRTIRYAYKANLANADFQSTSDVVLTVYSRSTLKASRPVLRNGQTVVFRGLLKSRPIPRGGVLIDLQARVGTRWQTFKTARARTSGRWKVRYRFTSTRGVRTYAFRARVRQDTGYPYAISKTRAVRVKVIG